MGAFSVKRSPMKPSTKPMARGAGFARKPEGARKVMRKVSKTNAKRPATGEDKLCRGQPCYLVIPGCKNEIDTVVPCHSNSSFRGKGMGIKAHDRFTVPGCSFCHYELDFGKKLDKEERREIWERAYEKWEPERKKLYGV